MTTRRDGADQYLRIRLKANPEEAWIVLSGVARGLDGTDFTNTQGLRDIPGGGVVVGKEPDGNREPTLTIAGLDENSLTKSLIGTAGRTYEYEYGPDGNATGDPKFTGEGPITFNRQFDGGGRRRFTNVVIVNDGAITVGTYA